VSGTILIYGATGYTGKLLAKAAADAGARPILAGRPPAVRQREIGFSAQSCPDGRINVVAAHRLARRDLRRRPLRLLSSWPMELPDRVQWWVNLRRPPYLLIRVPIPRKDCAAHHKYP
jgi:hypothetical protein